MACNTDQPLTVGDANVIYLIPADIGLVEEKARPEVILDPAKQADYDLSILTTSDWSVTNQGIANGKIEAILIHHAAIDTIDLEQMQTYFLDLCLPVMIIGDEKQTDKILGQISGRPPNLDWLNIEPELVASYRTTFKNGLGRSAGTISLEREPSLILTTIWGELDRKSPTDPCKFAEHTPDPSMEATRDAFLESEGIVIPQDE